MMGAFTAEAFVPFGSVGKALEEIHLSIVGFWVRALRLRLFRG